MRIVLPTATIASISGAALIYYTSHEVAASISFTYDESTDIRLRSIQANMKTSQGVECSFANGSNVQENQADIGILHCGQGETCTEDDRSSLGGRCVTLQGEVPETKLMRLLMESSPPKKIRSVNTDRIITAGLEASECSLANNAKAQDNLVGFHGCKRGLVCIEDGTSSTGGRCIKDEKSLLQSIDGPIACFFNDGITSGTKCDGVDACVGVVDTSQIGCGSCVGTRSCAFLVQYGDVTIGESSCVGYKACYEISSDVIEDESCHGDYSCFFINGNVGAGSCQYESACALTGGDVDRGSCNEYAACAWTNAHFGQNSCNGFFACFLFGYASSGTYRQIGYNSCNDDRACTYTSYTNIGDCLCNLYKSCYRLDRYVDMDYNNCIQTNPPSSSPSTSPTSSPSSAPSISPSRSPSTSPSVSPSNSPSVSPTANPSTSPSTSPTQNPTSSPTTFPSTSPTSSPSNAPSISPSKSPSTSPSASPSNSPSVSPTANPSTSPSTSPTANPTASPSQSPTASPSLSPSVSPSKRFGGNSPSPISKRPSPLPSASPIDLGEEVQPTSFPTKAKTSKNEKSRKSVKTTK